jgi:hypothetical protein
MKTSFRTTIATVLFSVCFTLSAQDEIIYSTVKVASLALTAIVQTADGGTNKVRINSKDILAVLNATGAFNFTNNPQLFLRSYNGGLPYFVVRDSDTNEIDVSEYLTVTEPDDAVHGHNQKINWGIWNVTLNGGTAMDFTFWGLTILHSGAIPTPGGGSLERTVSLESVGSGPGHLNGANAQFSGKVSANHVTLD